MSNCTIPSALCNPTCPFGTYDNNKGWCEPYETSSTGPAWYGQAPRCPAGLSLCCVSGTEYKDGKCVPIKDHSK